MGEGPKDLRDEPERLDAPRSSDVTGRTSENMVGRTMADTGPAAPGTRPYDAGVSSSTPPTADEEAANAGGTTETAAIRAEIEQKRADISGTIEEIQSRLSPRNIVSSATESTRDRVRQFADTAGEKASQVADQTRVVAGQVADRTREVAGRAADHVRENPWPAVAVAAGIGGAAWWMMRRRPDEEYEELDVDDYTEETLYYDDFSATGGNRIVNVIRDHPIPVALTAIGIGLLLRNRSAGSRESFGTRGDIEQGWGTEGDYGADAGSYRSFGEASWETGERPADRVRGAVADATDRARDAMSGAAERARGAADRAREKFAGVSSRTRQAARQTGTQITNASRRAKTELEYWMERNPLAVGGAALALGMAVGLALPETRQEQRMMGGARDRLVDRAQDIAGQAVEKAQQVAGDVANKASEAMRSSSQGPSSQGSPSQGPSA